MDEEQEIENVGKIEDEDDKEDEKDEDGSGNKCVEQGRGTQKRKKQKPKKPVASDTESE